MIRGHAQDDKESFEFTIKPFVTGGFMLSIDYRGDGREGLTGAGVWISVERAKQIAEETAVRLLQGANTIWDA